MSLPRAAVASLHLAELAAVAGGVYAFDWAFHNNFCTVLFHCNCTYPWAGGWDECNIHDPDAPHCPWCAASPETAWTTTYLVQAVAVLAYFAAAAAWSKGLGLTPIAVRTLAARRRPYREVADMEASLAERGALDGSDGDAMLFDVAGGPPERRGRGAKSPRGAAALRLAAVLIAPFAAWALMCTLVGLVFFLTDDHKYPYFLFIDRS